MPNLSTSSRPYREIESRRTANREQKAIDFAYLRCPECGTDYDPKEGTRGFCSSACQLNSSFNSRRDSGESASTFGYRW